MKYRIEKDTMGEVRVPEERLWAAQTQRSLQNFKIGSEKMPIEIIKAFAVLKKSAALTNASLGKLDNEVAQSIGRACDEIYAGNLDEEFPLVVWQTGSGTQSNMNVNEVIAGYINKNSNHRKVHPNDDVNKSQSSNDTFPTAMHIACVEVLKKRLIPAVDILESTFAKLRAEYNDIIKIGRTHLQDATPLTLGQEISGWEYMLSNSKNMIESSIEYLSELALGGTAVGTGLNAPVGFAEEVAKQVSNETGYDFITAKNKFHSLTSKDAIVNSHGAIKSLAANLLKIANDIRFLASGPRSGIGEITIPENEPGSSIMPGKVNPTQSEALTMVCVQVMGNDTTIGISASQGNFELNVYMPVIIYNYLQSANLLADAITSFNDNCAAGIKPNHAKLQENLENSLMLVTALNTHIGYEKSAEIAKNAHEKGITLKESALELEYLTAQEFDKYVVAADMVGNIK